MAASFEQLLDENLSTVIQDPPCEELRTYQVKLEEEKIKNK